MEIPGEDVTFFPPHTALYHWPWVPPLPTPRTGSSRMGEASKAGKYGGLLPYLPAGDLQSFSGAVTEAGNQKSHWEILIGIKLFCSP